MLLLSMDTAGVAMLISVLTRCARSGSARLIDNARMYTFVVEPGADRVELVGRHSVWRLDIATLTELVRRLRSLHRMDRAGVESVAISAPTDTLLLWRRHGAYDGLTMLAHNGNRAVGGTGFDAYAIDGEVISRPPRAVTG